MIPEDIRDAIARGDREAVEALLNAEELDLNAFSLDALLGMCVLAAAQSLLRLRSLVSRGRATLKRRRSRRRAAGGSYAQAKHAIEFLVKLGDNGVVWNILSFWKETA